MSVILYSIAIFSLPFSAKIVVSESITPRRGRYDSIDRWNYKKHAAYQISDHLNEVESSHDFLYVARLPSDVKRDRLSAPTGTNTGVSIKFLIIASKLTNEDNTVCLQKMLNVHRHNKSNC